MFHYSVFFFSFYHILQLCISLCALGCLRTSFFLVSFLSFSCLLFFLFFFLFFFFFCSFYSYFIAVVVHISLCFRVLKNYFFFLASFLSFLASPFFLPVSSIKYICACSSLLFLIISI